MPDKYKLADGNPRNSTGFSTLYPDRIKALEQHREERKKQIEPLDAILSREAAAELLGISLSTLDRRVREKAIPYSKIGGRVLFSKFRLEDWLRSKEVLPAEHRDFSISKSFITHKEALDLGKRAARTLELADILSGLL